MDSVEAAGMSYVDVAGATDRWTGKKSPTKVLMVKKFNKALAESDTISMISNPSYRWSREEYGEAINKGLVMGTMLGKKLQVRGESRETKWSRLDSGRLDKRLVAELGFGNERVFKSTFVEEYSDAFLHISVDASGSMGGDKWTNTQTAVVAIAKACSMINNVDLVISYRSTQAAGTNRYGRGGKSYPLMLIAYDSRVDKISKVKNLFHLLRPSGTTPEGLCFEAVMKEIEMGSNDKESYFLNFSDGMPMFSNDEIDYHYDTAINHTAKMVKEIKNRGVKVLSYFIGGRYDYRDETKTFTKMYGTDAQFVDVTSVLPIAKTMNKKFLEK
jgi:nitric oxide reductase activation protein